MEQGVPLPYCATGPWAPPGIARPWPRNEYLCDGGDQGVPVGVTRQGEVRGLELEDTVAHYDTLDGRTVVEPTNRVCIYSPRFGAVRQVVNLASGEQADRSAGVSVPTRLAAPTTTQIVASSKQHVQAERQTSARPPVVFQTRQDRDVLSTVIGPRGFQDAFMPHENLKLIRVGEFDEAEMAFLARGSTAAIAWSQTQAVQVILDEQAAMAEVGVQDSPAVYTINAPPANPRLRVMKVASTPFAEPGDTVDFTIRFDNVGNQPIGNVTIIDNLTTRLEYVAQSAQCSLPTQFSTQVNEGDSLVLRCELSDPLAAGNGGILRFRCRVR